MFGNCETFGKSLFAEFDPNGCAKCRKCLLGMPKGVLLTHGNLLACVAGGLRRLRLSSYLGGPNANAPPFLQYTDRYVAYLPLAHVLELICELTLLSVGATIGYSAPACLTDNGTKIKPGTFLFFSFLFFISFLLSFLSSAFSTMIQIISFTSYCRLASELLTIYELASIKSFAF